MDTRKNAARVLAALFLMLARTASSTENGLTTYPLGVNTVLDGILPPPGITQFYNYTEYYFANKFAGPDGNSAIPGFHSEALVDAARVVHTWGGTLGPFTVSSGVVAPLVHLHLDVPGASGTRTAPGDIIVQPFMIGYTNSSHTFFAFLTNDVSLPTGAYAANRLVNIGVNYYAYQPNLSMTWFPSPRWEMSSTAQVEFHSPNHATNYHSGDVASLDYLIGYSVTERVQLGLQGYFLKQFTDDTINGQTAPDDGFRGQTIGIGPQLRYAFGPDKAIAFKYEHEFAVRNRPQGDRLWVQFAFPI
jgi:hypothetical protein